MCNPICFPWGLFIRRRKYKTENLIKMLMKNKSSIFSRINPLLLFELIVNYLKISVYKRALSQIRISCIQSL